ncbi:TPR-like protein [Neoconidiobolus thromboides FSU 785]|nr:TPR-like protein [Neoconidiobolus thromboides FSU 785]
MSNNKNIMRTSDGLDETDDKLDDFDILFAETEQIMFDEPIERIKEEMPKAVTTDDMSDLELPNLKEQLACWDQYDQATDGYAEFKSPYFESEENDTQGFDPDFLKLKLSIETFIQEEDYVSSLYIANLMNDLYPERDLPKYLVAKSLYHLGNYHAAHRLLKEIPQDQMDIITSILFAKICLKLNNFVDAEQILSKYKDLNNYQVQLILGKVYNLLNRKDQAELHFDRAWKLNAFSYSAYNSLCSVISLNQDVYKFINRIRKTFNSSIKSSALNGNQNGTISLNNTPVKVKRHHIELPLNGALSESGSPLPLIHDLGISLDHKVKFSSKPYHIQRFQNFISWPNENEIDNEILGTFSISELNTETVSSKRLRDDHEGDDPNKRAENESSQQKSIIDAIFCDMFIIKASLTFCESKLGEAHLALLPENVRKGQWALGMHAQVLLRQEETTSAKDKFTKMLNSYPHLIEHMEHYIGFLLKKKDFGGISGINSILEIMAPDSMVSHLAQAAKCFVQGHDETGVEFLEETKRLFPGEWAPYYIGGLRHLQLKNYHEANDNFQLALKFNPRHFESYLGVLSLSTVLGNFDEYIDLIKMGIKLSHSHLSINKLALQTFFSLGKYDEVRDILNRYTDKDKDIPGISFYRAVMLAYDKKFTQAKAILEEILKTYPNHASARVILGRIYCYERKDEEAYFMFAIAQNLDPSLKESIKDFMVFINNMKLKPGRLEEAAFEISDLVISKPCII